MNGKVSKDFTSRVTHLVTSSVFSEKYRAAVKFGKCVVRPEWIEESWREKELQDPERFRLPPFAGCEICVSGLEVAQREHVRQQTEQNGGRYCAALQQTCTHLIVSVRVHLSGVCVWTVFLTGNLGSVWSKIRCG